MKPSTFLILLISFIVIGLIPIFGLRVNLENDAELQSLTNRYELTIKEVRSVGDQILETPLGKEHNYLFSQIAQTKDQSEKQILKSRLRTTTDQLSATSLGEKYNSLVGEADRIFKERRQIFDVHVSKTIFFMLIPIGGMILSTAIFLKSMMSKRNQPIP